MPRVLTAEELDAKAMELGTVGDAIVWARQNGYELPGAGAELPPIEQSGALAVAVEDQPMDDKNEEGGALDYASLDFGQIRTDPGAFFKTLLDSSRVADERAAQSAKQLYEQGRQRIMDKYAGPSEAERLYALSRAMLSPRDVPGFGGFVGNVVGALGQNAEAMRKAEQAREEQLFALQQQYLQGEATRAAARPRTAADLASKYLTATKAPAKSATSPVMVGPDMKTRVRATGAELRQPPNEAIYRLQAYLQDPNNIPENKTIARRNFDAKFGYGASNIYAGEE